MTDWKSSCCGAGVREAGREYVCNECGEFCEVVRVFIGGK